MPRQVESTQIQFNPIQKYLDFCVTWIESNFPRPKIKMPCCFFSFLPENKFNSIHFKMLNLVLFFFSPLKRALRACSNRIVIVANRNNQFFFECFGRGVQTESTREKRNAAEKQRRVATYGPFKTMYTCRHSSARQHRSTRAADIYGISTPGGRWASHGGGRASNVDAPGSIFKLY